MTASSTLNKGIFTLLGWFTLAVLFIGTLIIVWAKVNF
jgi:hypothetical protein